MDAHGTEKRRGTSLTPNIRLRYHRKMHQWTQADLANELYQLCDFNERERGIISVGMISGWERGEHTPSPFWQKKLCTLFATTPDDLGLLDIASPTVSETKERDHNLFRYESGRYAKLVNYLQQQRKRLFDTLASGSTYLRVGDIIGQQGLFVPPPWEDVLDPTVGGDLTQHLATLLCQRQRILLLGEAGQGKTTILKRVFVQLIIKAQETPG
jgi:transcriptional regulator with XRE-family HTH domain